MAKVTDIKVIEPKPLDVKVLEPRVKAEVSNVRAPRKEMAAVQKATTLKDDIEARFPGFFQPDGWKIYGDKIATMKDGTPVIDDGAGLLDLRTLKPYEPNTRVRPDGAGRFEVINIDLPPPQRFELPPTGPIKSVAPAAPTAAPTSPAAPSSAASPTAALTPQATAARGKLASLAGLGQSLVSQGDQAVATQAASVDAGVGGGGVDNFLAMG